MDAKEPFLPIEMKDQQFLSKYLDMYPENEGSECTFSNLFIWGQSEDVRWKIIDDCLLLHAKARGEKPCMLMAFAPPGRLSAAIDWTVDAMRRLGEPFQMHSLPAWYCDLMRDRFPGRFVFEREPHHDDYVYAADDLIHLTGKKLHGKRNHINKFMSIYADRYTYEPYAQGMSGECMLVHERWLEGQEDTQALREERESVRRALENADALGLVGGVLRVDGKAEAFSIGERITPDMALIHIEKANAEIPGIFSVINRDFVKNEFSDLMWVNREEDMGDEGLRRAKRSYQPARMIEKYGARLADGS